MYRLIEELLEGNTLLNIDPNELDAEERLEALLLQDRNQRASSKVVKDQEKKVENPSGLIKIEDQKKKKLNNPYEIEMTEIAN